MASRPQRRRPCLATALTLVLVLVLTLASGLGTVSCRPAGPATGPADTGAAPPAVPGAGGTAPGAEPSGWALAPVRLNPVSGGGAVAVGPFTNLRSFGWLEGGLAWGWGDLSDTRQVLFTLGVDGAVRAAEIPRPCWPAGPRAVPGRVAWVSLHYPEAGEVPPYMTAWYYPLEGQTACLGRAEGVRPSPSGKWLLRYSPDGTWLHDAATKVAAPVAAIPVEGFPYAGCNTTWADDSLALVCQSLQPGPGQGLRLVRLPEGEVLAEMQQPGQHLAPFASPGGAWLAVLAIDDETALWPEEAIHPVNAGQEIRVYARAALDSPEPAPVATLSPAPGLAAQPVWAADGARLVFAVVTAVSLGPWGLGTAYEGPSRLVVATAPAFHTVDLPLAPGRVWLPLSFSPLGRYLALRAAAEPADPSVQSGEPSMVLIWDFDAQKAVALPDSMDSWFVEWVGSDLLCLNVLDPATGGRRLLLASAGTGETRPVEWPGHQFSASPEGYLASEVSVQAGEPLGPLGPVAAGQWLVLFPAPVAP